MSIGSAYPSRDTIPDCVTVRGVWTGGGAGQDCAVADGDWNRGIASIAYTSAAGCYTITFQDVGQQIVGWHISMGQQTGVDPVSVVLRNGTFSTSTKSVIVEVNTGGTLTDFLTTDKLYVEFTFAKNGPP